MKGKLLSDINNSNKNSEMNTLLLNKYNMNFNSIVLTIIISIIAIVCLKILHNYWKILKGTESTQIE